MTESKKRWTKPVLIVLGALLVCGAYVAARAHRLYSVGRDLESQVRYLIENGGTIGEVPAEQAFSVDFLEAIFGDDPELLAQLKAMVRKGLSDEPALHVGEVAAMLVTYQSDENGAISDVVIHAIGGFPLARRKPSFHRHGYFFQQIDPNLWNYGNTLLGFLGRDVVLFASDDATVARQQELIDTLFQGEIIPLAERIRKPMYYTMVLPEPKHIVPPQLRKHVQAAVFKGFLSPYQGKTDLMLLCPDARSAAYTLQIAGDMKLVTELLLKTRWGGVERETLWGKVRNPWWAYEMVQNLERSTLKREETLVRFHSEFERVMVNAILKVIERASRDMAAMRMVQDERLDPREADAKLRTKKPLHYWSEAHQWGPDWPIPPIVTGTNAVGDTAASGDAKGAETTGSQPAADAAAL